MDGTASPPTTAMDDHATGGRAIEVIFGLGANLGAPVRQLTLAVEKLRAVVEVVQISSVYRTEPIGFSAQPDFYNLVLVARSSSAPELILEQALRVERELGRIRTFQNAPRAIDIDLLAWEGGTVSSPLLQLPHPRLHERAFMLIPLAEVAPRWRHPVLDLSAGEMLARLEHPGRVERHGDL